MKTVLRISIFINILLGIYLLLKTIQLFAITEEVPVEPVVSAEEKITCDTVYRISVYDVTTGREDVIMEELPDSLMGMNRRQLLHWLEDYNNHPSLEDREMGLLSLELISFSGEEIFLRKRLSREPAKEEKKKEESKEELLPESFGYILAKDGVLVVYDRTREKLLLTTEISLFDLPQSLQEEIMVGKEVSSEAELYYLLESYSS